MGARASGRRDAGERTVQPVEMVAIDHVSMIDPAPIEVRPHLARVKGRQ